MKVGIPVLCFAFLWCGAHAAGRGRKNIKYRMKPKSWITDDQFSVVLMLSYPTSKCCNIYLSNATEGVEAVFEQFRKIYPYQYLLRRKIYGCHGYFLVGSDENEVASAVWHVPSTISSTEILIVMGNNVSDDSILLNVTLYRNSNVNIISPSGMWSLSENYLEPRIFTKIHKYAEMAHGHRTINLNGRELQIATTYFPPSCYLKREIKKTIDGVETYVFLAEDEEERDGIEFKVFLLLAEKLNFTWTIRNPSRLQNTEYRKDTEVWVTGLLGMVAKGEVDMSFAAIWLTLNSSRYVNISEHLYQYHVNFLVPRPKPYTGFWALGRPFSAEVWMVLVTLILVQSLNLVLHARINPAYPKHLRHFVVTLTEMIGRLLGGIIPKDAKGCRLQMLMWHIAGVLIVTAYSSSLAARLSSSEYEARIDTVEQFMKRNLSWIMKSVDPAYSDYFDLEDKYSSQFPSKFVIIKSKEEKETLMKRGKLAFLGTVVESLFIPDNEISDDDLKNYRVMKESVGKFYVSFAVQPWLLEPVNRIILSLKETGIIFFHIRDVLRRRVSLHLREVVIEHDHSDGKARVLTLMPLGAGFSILIIGLSISTCVFYSELKYASGDKPVRELLRTINRKRKFYELSKSLGHRIHDNGM